MTSILATCRNRRVAEVTADGILHPFQGMDAPEPQRLKAMGDPGSPQVDAWWAQPDGTSLPVVELRCTCRAGRHRVHADRVAEKRAAGVARVPVADLVRG